MIRALKTAIKRRWPPLRLRTILFGTLLFAAALPGAGAVFLRVYENTLVRQTEAELVAQGAALVAAAAASWNADRPATSLPPRAARIYQPEASTIDLRSTPVLGERPRAAPHAEAPEPAAVQAAGRMAPVIAATQRTTLASIQLVDRSGVVVLGHEAGGSYASLPEVSGALNGRVHTVLRQNGAYSQRYALEWLSRASSLRIHHVRPIIADGRVVGALLLSRSPRALFRGLYEDRGKIILGAALIFVALVVLTGLLSRGIARPIEALAKATRGVAAGAGTVPETPVTAAIEIRGLFEDFRVMAAEIDRRSRYLRDFAASVSHEFKTPLAGISGAVELFEDHGERMTGAERERFLGNIKADAERLSQLVTRLLDLARADMTRPHGEAMTEALSVVRQVADAFDAPDFRLAVISNARELHAAAPAAAVEAVLGTLLENARQADANCVEVRAQYRDGNVEIRVTDNGGGIAPGDAERIFEPFFTTRRTSGGTGLGLAISASLVRANGGQIALAASGEDGSTFVLTLPGAR